MRSQTKDSKMKERIRKVRKKLNNKKGFTLVEMLLAVLILLLVSAIVVSGIPAAKNAYEKVVLASNAEILLSTSISSLRNELGTAQDITISTASTTDTNATVIDYYNENVKTTSRIYLAASGTTTTADGTVPEGTIMYLQYSGADGLSAASDPVRLVSKQASTGDLFVTYDKVEYSGGVITFTNLSVNRSSGSTGLASRDTLSIRVLAAN